MGHLGLTPRASTNSGTYNVRARSSRKLTPTDAPASGVRGWPVGSGGEEGVGRERRAPVCLWVIYAVREAAEEGGAGVAVGGLKCESGVGR